MKVYTAKILRQDNGFHVFFFVFVFKVQTLARAQLDVEQQIFFLEVRIAPPINAVDHPKPRYRSGPFAKFRVSTIGDHYRDRADIDAGDQRPD